MDSTTIEDPRGLSEEDQKAIVEWAYRHPEIQEVYLYGSRARGDYRPDSDIDLAVVMEFLDWFDFIDAFRREPDLHLSSPAHLEWFNEDAGLERVGGGVARDGVLLFQR